MKERPRCRRGIEVPMKVPNLIDDEKGADAFARNAEKILQR
jgi:hypothetical protein